MIATAQLLEQRSVGAVTLRMEAGGIAVLREAGSAKCRLPRGSREAILVNTSGGLAGGDTVTLSATAARDATLTLTSQAAERVYRSLGPDALITTHLAAEDGARLHWLPQETILFDGAALRRRFEVQLDGAAEFLALEAIVLGRTESGETVHQASLHDSWRIYCDGDLIHADEFHFSGPPPNSDATLKGAAAFATLVMVSARVDAVLEPLREAFGESGGASAWNGKLVARLVAKDGFQLRKHLVSGLSSLLGASQLPKVWTF